MSFIDKEELYELGHNDEKMMITYNGAIDEDILNVLKETSHENFYYTHIGERLGLDGKYVELILHLLHQLGLTEYGGSPRGSWISDEGREYLGFHGIGPYLKQEFQFKADGKTLDV